MFLPHTDELYRLILDNALDAFIAIDEQSRIVEWTQQAEKTFGWTRDEALGQALTDTIIPERYKAAHLAGLHKFLQSGTGAIVGRRIELPAMCKNGTEIPIELTVTPMTFGDSAPMFSASLRDISTHRALQQEVRQQENLTVSILASMAGAVVVADVNERIILINPAAQRLLNMREVSADPHQSFRDYQLLKTDGITPYPDHERPIARALQGEQVNGLIGLVCNQQCDKDIWVSANARPLRDEHKVLIGAVVVFHDITELHRREAALELQADLLKEQASLLDLTRDAIVVRDENDRITYWNNAAERLYGYTSAEAIGQHSHTLFRTRFPMLLEEIRNAMHDTHFWEGELLQIAKNGRQLTVFSQWVMDNDGKRPLRYLETNTDITQRVQTEQAFKELQENYRLIVETSSDYAIIMTDPDGMVVSWNLGAENIIGMSPQEAIGQPISRISTPEDNSIGQPSHELQKTRQDGRANDVRWHIRKDGSRFWANGVTMPLSNADGSLRGFVKILRDQTAERLAEEQTQYLANHDMLTGLSNRVSFSNQLHKAIAVSERTRLPLAVLLLDLDKFKQVNDTLGHHAGDLLLKEVARRILTSLRETDVVARLGGDEFVVIQTEIAQPAAAETLACKLIAELGSPYQIEGADIVSGTSIGIATYPADAKNPVELLKRADLALYRAKSSGRGTYRFYSPDLAVEQSWQKDREQALRDALANGEFALYYQPQIDLRNWTIVTVEALLRWQANDLEMILPDDFLATAEQTGLIVELGDWALRQACRQVRKWQENGMPDLRISVNCSARQFSDAQFVKRIRPILQETGLASSSLELEITESMLMTQPDIKQQLTELRALGVRIAIDNYGTSNIALIDLKEFDVDGLKIDKAFVQHLPHRHRDSAITSAIITLAHNLGIDVSAGGVETAEQLAYLKARDCTSAQGFIFSPPLPPQEFEEMMLSGHWSRINRIPGYHAHNPRNDFH